MDRENHASLYDGCRLSYGKMLRYQHNDMAGSGKEAAEGAGDRRLPDRDRRRVLHGRRHCKPAGDLRVWHKQYGARVMVDDAHGLGVIGEGGRGTASYYGLEDQVDIYMGTFSKSLASPRRLYGGQSSRVADYRASQLAPVYLLGLHSARKLRGGACRAARAGSASGAGHEAAAERAVYAKTALRNERNIRMRASNGEIACRSFRSTPMSRCRRSRLQRSFTTRACMSIRPCRPAAAPHECLLAHEPDGHAHARS